MGAVVALPFEQLVAGGGEQVGPELRVAAEVEASVGGQHVTAHALQQVEVTFMGPQVRPHVGAHEGLQAAEVLGDEFGQHRLTGPDPGERRSRFVARVFWRGRGRLDHAAALQRRDQGQARWATGSDRRFGIPRSLCGRAAFPTCMSTILRFVPHFLALVAAAAAVAQEASSMPARIAAPGVATALPDLGPLPPLVLDAISPAETWAVGRGYKARVTVDGLLFHALPGSELPLAPVALRLQQVQVGGSALPLRSTKLPDAGVRCQLDHGSLIEHLDLRPEGVEQSFRFDSLPERGELVLRLAVTTALAAEPKDGGVRFGSGPQAVHYGSATVLDADGQRLELPSEWHEGGLRITVPAAFVEQARLPLVVDPLMSSPATWGLGLGTGTNLSVAGPELAYSPITASWLMVWQVQVASNDHDAYARRFDGAWSPLASAQGVDLTTADWGVPEIAHLAVGDEWRIAAQVDTSTTTGDFDVVLRRWSAAGPVGAAFVVGNGTITPFLNTPWLDRVAIGGDPYAGVGASRVLVAWTHLTDVRYRTVDQAGVLGPLQSISVPGLIGTRGINISKGNGANRWLVCFGTYDMSIALQQRAALVDYQGNLLLFPGSGVTSVVGGGSLFPLDNWVMETSSPDANGDFTVVYGTSASPPAIMMRKLRSDGSLSAPASLGTLAPGWVQSRTCVETDGVRSLFTQGQGNNVRGVLLAHNSTTDTWRKDDEFTITDTMPVRSTAPTSRYVYGTSSQVTPFVLGYGASSSTLSVLRIVQYAGYSPGMGYATYPAACGSPLSLNHDGTVPALGNTVRFNLGTAYPLAGFLFGTPALIPLTGICNCSLAVNGSPVLGNQLVLPIPLDVSLVGQVFSTQGFSFQSGPCFGSASLSLAIDMTIM